MGWRRVGASVYAKKKLYTAGQKYIFPHHDYDTPSSFSKEATVKMLYLVGLGLSDETDITVKGLAVVKSAARVYLEAYTSILLVDKEVLVRISFAPDHMA